MNLPIIHSNGTSPETLLEGYRRAMNAVQAAGEAIMAVEFNARDYYPNNSWEDALAERIELRRAIEKVYNELTAHAVHCYDHLKK